MRLIFQEKDISLRLLFLSFQTFDCRWRKRKQMWLWKNPTPSGWAAAFPPSPPETPASLCPGTWIVPKTKTMSTSRATETGSGSACSPSVMMPFLGTETATSERGRLWSPACSLSGWRLTSTVWPFTRHGRQTQDNTTAMWRSGCLTLVTPGTVWPPTTLGLQSSTCCSKVRPGHV